MFLLTLIRGAELAEGVTPQVSLPETLARFAIGRDPANPWSIPDRTLAISACHCEIVASAAGPVLRDLSTNGTFVNGAPDRLVGEHLLADDDVFELGPYAIRVSQPGRAKASPATSGAAAAPSSGSAALKPSPATPPAVASGRAPSLPSAAAQRGGDPAAMLAAAGDGPAAFGLTEILRSVAPTDDADLEVTKIRMAPKAGAQHAPSAPAKVAEGAARPTAMRPPEVLPDAPPAAPLAPAALPPQTNAQALPTDTSPIEALALAAVQALRQLLDHQAQARRQIGSRSPSMLALRPLAALRMPATPQEALQSLCAPGADAAASVKCAADALAAHHNRLLAAFRGAAQRLAADISPLALQAALGAADTDAQKARLWDLYAGVWQTLGTASGSSWEQGLLDAALQHLATAYDDPGKP